MPIVPGLTIVVASADAERFHAALSLAAANAALGQRSRLFLQGEAARLLAGGPVEQDAERTRHGIPSQAELIEEALAMQVELIVCQSGLALAGMSAEALPPAVKTGGLIELLSSRGDDQLMMA
jgi:predicted peroxiredoxin